MEQLAFTLVAAASEAPSVTSEDEAWQTAVLKIPRSAQMGLLSAAVLTAIVSTPADAMAAVEIGDRGAQVENVQRVLKTQGFYQGSVDGIFGNGTKTAVIKFQQAKGLAVDGIVGPATERALGIAGGGSGGKPGSYRVSTASGVKIRSDAATSATVLGYLGEGAQLTLTAEEKTANGHTWGKLADRSGWVAKDYLTFVSDNSSSGGGGTAGVYRVNTSRGIKIRSDASTSASVLDSAANGEQLTLTTEEKRANGFVWGKLANGSGWVAKEFLAFVSAGGSGGGAPVAYRVNTPSGIRIRQTPGSGGDVLGYLEDGDRITLTSEERRANGFLWGKLASRSGWVAKDYLVSVASSTASPTANTGANTNASTGASRNTSTATTSPTGNTTSAADDIDINETEDVAAGSEPTVSPSTSATGSTGSTGSTGTTGSTGSTGTTSTPDSTADAPATVAPSPSASPSDVTAIAEEVNFEQGQIALVNVDSISIHSQPDPASTVTASLPKDTFVAYTKQAKLTSGAEWYFLPAYKGWVDSSTLQILE